MKLVLAGVELPLSDFSLRLDATLSAPVTGIFGPSGAGKTSLLDLLAGLRRAQTGRIELDGELLSDAARGLHLEPRYRRLGYVPQDGALFPHLSVRRNLLYGYRPELASAAMRFEAVLALLALEPLLERRIAHLSGGERQRVALGRALLCAPRLLLLDEPLSGLDAELKTRIVSYLRAIRRELGLPMLYVSHHAEEILELCDEVLILERGQLVERGSPALLLAPSTWPARSLESAS
ncbi:MAG TPA: ATP-binding cassette domain-containing protein [Thermoanaerobaculia bacterium]|nr:ATP-binding cassette domain-containing protein [Thermoanaerobaculia bacterium]